MQVYNNQKFPYQVRHVWGYLLPKCLFQRRLEQKIAKYHEKHPEQWDYVQQRVNYYCKLQNTTPLPASALVLRDFTFDKKYHFSYFFDTYQYLKYFPNTSRFCCEYGDIVTIPPVPTIVKSRPIGDDNENSILLKLNRFRHFNFIKDTIPFADKADKLVGRGFLYQKKRIDFYTKWFGTRLCDLGQVNPEPVYNEAWLQKKMSRREHLNHKFILCLEGNDVATNLKWVMLTNSLAVMPRPHYETWFMEAKLIPNYHYVAIADDYSDLEERLEYYMEHQDEAQQIIANAKAYVSQFLDFEREDIISLLVLKKYFEKTGQR